MGLIRNVRNDIKRLWDSISEYEKFCLREYIVNLFLTFFGKLMEALFYRLLLKIVGRYAAKPV